MVERLRKCHGVTISVPSGADIVLPLRRQSTSKAHILSPNTSLSLWKERLAHSSTCPPAMRLLQYRIKQPIAAASLPLLVYWRYFILVRSCSPYYHIASTQLTQHLDSPNIRCFSIHPGAVDTELLHELERKMGLRLRWRWTDPLLTGAAALWLTTPRAEFLRGRWISVNWRMDELEARKEEIVDQNLLKFAFNAKLGV